MNKARTEYNEEKVEGSKIVAPKKNGDRNPTV